MENRITSTELLLFELEQNLRGGEYVSGALGCCSIFSDGSSLSPVWGCSSAGRAPALQAGGQGFESLHLHHQGEILENGANLKPNEKPVCSSGG